MCDGRTSQVTRSVKGTEVGYGHDLRCDAISESRREERRDPDLTMVGQEAEEVAKELFVFKGLEKNRTGEKMNGNKQKAPGGTRCSPEFGREVRCPETLISSAASMWI